MQGLERSRGETSFIDVLDRVLDKGVVIDGWARVSVAGIDLMTIDGWVVVASIQTYLQYADSLGIDPRLPDTRQQKILMLVGPKRSGKGTIAKVLAQLIGLKNVCAPTLASLGMNFGLWPLVGKSLAIIADARLSNRSDIAHHRFSFRRAIHFAGAGKPGGGADQRAVQLSRAQCGRLAE